MTIVALSRTVFSIYGLTSALYSLQCSNPRSNQPPAMDRDKYVGNGVYYDNGNYYDPGDDDYSWNTGHSPCGDDDN